VHCIAYGFWYYLSFWYRKTCHLRYYRYHRFWYYLSFWYRKTRLKSTERLQRFWYYLSFWYRKTKFSFRSLSLLFWYYLSFWYRKKVMILMFGTIYFADAYDLLATNLIASFLYVHLPHLFVFI